MELYPRLVVVNGKEPGRTFALPFACTVLGRSEKVGIPLREYGISRHHARFMVDQGRVKFEDLKSTNGSYLNGKKVVASMLRNGDTLQFGNCRMIFRSDRPSPKEGKIPYRAKRENSKGRKSPSPSPSPQSQFPSRRKTKMNQKTIPKLHHEDLDSYQASINFLVLAFRVIESLPRGHSALANQFRKAALSIPLNIAEGYGKRGRSDRANFYDIARGSAHECGAVLDSARVLKVVGDEEFSSGKRLLRRIVSMLVKMSA